MQKELPKSITIVGRVIRMTKRVTDKCINTKNVSISQAEKDAVGALDIVEIIATDKNDNNIGTASYMGTEFHSSLVKRQKRTKSGRLIHFYTLGY